MSIPYPHYIPLSTLTRVFDNGGEDDIQHKVSLFGY